MKDLKKINTLGALKKSGYQSRSIRTELRDNLISKIRNKEARFEGILGYEDTVIPALENAILAKHDINLLGLRGQAKTRIARAMVELLDEYIPVIEGSVLNEDPFNPITSSSQELIRKMKDDTPVAWMHKSERYAEKLATPDVSVADLIGDIDPIKAANLKLDYGDERVIHYGIIPRSNRGIFVINELPDLQPRIQVSLFNMLQEKDIQIRGFKFMLPIDIQFVFTANPEDYTNRGSIITPLKDRIQSQIVTHYPMEIDTAIAITEQEVKITEEQSARIYIPKLIKELIENIAIEARSSEFVDAKSGVSVRLSISAFECVISSAERRNLINGEKETTVRMSDLNAAIPAIVGKIEMVYEGEQEGAVNVGHKLLAAAIRSLALKKLPGINEIQTKKKKSEENLSNSFTAIIDWFRSGKVIDLLIELNQKEYEDVLKSIDGLPQYIKNHFTGLDKEEEALMMEFVLHALAAYSLLDKKNLVNSNKFQDLFSSYFPLEN